MYVTHLSVVSRGKNRKGALDLAVRVGSTSIADCSCTVVERGRDSCYTTGTRGEHAVGPMRIEFPGDLSTGRCQDGLITIEEIEVSTTHAAVVCFTDKLVLEPGVGRDAKHRRPSPGS